MDRTRWIFMIIMSLALCISGGLLLWTQYIAVPEVPLLQSQEPMVTSPPEVPIRVQVISAVPAYDWVNSAADSFNAQGNKIDGRVIEVEIIAMDGLSALNKWGQGEFDPLPTVWLAESRTWVDQANLAALERTQQDIFLMGGRYRAQPVVLSPLVWGIWKDAHQTLSTHFGTEQISWDEIHEAAVIGQWQNMGGQEEWGRFKLVVAHPKRDPAGLVAIVGAAGEYYDKPTISAQELQDPNFLIWLATQFDTVVDFSPFGAENMLLFGRSNGDAGQIVESYLLIKMEGLENRWGQALQIVYPDPIAWFDFPYAIYMGQETSALEKQAALQFKEYLLTADQQAAALDFGLRPACAECPSNGGLISRWQENGVRENIPSASRMRPASRSGLEALTKWYVETYEE